MRRFFFGLVYVCVHAKAVQSFFNGVLVVHFAKLWMKSFIEVLQIFRLTLRIAHNLDTELSQFIMKLITNIEIMHFRIGQFSDS